MKILNKQELMDNDEKLCDYCEFTEYGIASHKGVYCVGNLPVMCEGNWCEEAYNNYLEEMEKE